MDLGWSRLIWAVSQPIFSFFDSYNTTPTGVWYEQRPPMLNIIFFISQSTKSYRPRHQTFAQPMSRHPTINRPRANISQHATKASANTESQQHATNASAKYRIIDATGRATTNRQRHNNNFFYPNDPSSPHRVAHPCTQHRVATAGPYFFLFFSSLTLTLNIQSAASADRVCWSVLPAPPVLPAITGITYRLPYTIRKHTASQPLDRIAHNLVRTLFCS